MSWRASMEMTMTGWSQAIADHANSNPWYQEEILPARAATEGIAGASSASANTRL